MNLFARRATSGMNLKNVFIKLPLLFVGMALLGGCLLRTDVDTAFAKTRDSVALCEGMAQAGELEGRYQVTSCKAEELLRNLRNGRYPYMELAESYTMAVRELALQQDCDEIDAQEAKHYMNVAYSQWMNAEQDRCAQDRYAIERRKPGTFDVRPFLDDIKQTKTFACYNLQSTRITVE